MDASEPACAVVSGPLAPFEIEFRAELVRQGYAPSRVRDLVRVMARLSGWLADSGLAPNALTPQVAAGLRGQLRGVGPVVRFLRGTGVVPAADSMVDATPEEAVLGEFRAWLVRERGLADESVRCYVTQARPFLAQLPEPLEVDLGELDAGQVTAFMVAHCRDRTVGTAQAAVTAALPRRSRTSPAPARPLSTMPRLRTPSGRRLPPSAPPTSLPRVR